MVIIYKVYDLADLPPIPLGNDVFLVILKGEENIVGDFVTSEIHIYKAKAKYCSDLVIDGCHDFDFDAGAFLHYTRERPDEEEVDVSEIFLKIAEREGRHYNEVRKNVKVIKHY